jgi:hypothetical protein
MEMLFLSVTSIKPVDKRVTYFHFITNLIDLGYLNDTAWTVEIT